MNRVFVALPVAVGLAIAACGTGSPAMPSSPSSSDPAAGPAPSPMSTTASVPTYYKDVKPILDARCTQCHTKGGIAPIALTSASDVGPWVSMIAEKVASRIMPPWQAAPGCSSYLQDMSLTNEEMDTIARWAKGGGAMGNPADVGAKLPVNSVGLSKVDLELKMPAPYTPQIRPDDYHCFVLDWPETATKYVTGFRAEPGNPSIVHHAIAYLATPDVAASYSQLDPDGKGYTCFGGPGGPGNPQWIGTWTPGSTGNDFPAGTGVMVQAGSKIVLQVHYNTLTTIGQDQTTLQYRLADSVNKRAIAMPWANPDWLKKGGMVIPAGDPDVKYSFTFDPTPYLSDITGGVIPNGPFEIYGAQLHMHLLGVKTEFQVISKGKDECLLDIPHWDFHWQRMYELEHPMRFEPGDMLSISCQWDNSAANQPVIDGKQGKPKTVQWGEGTTDEMCVGLVYITAP